MSFEYYPQYLTGPYPTSEKSGQYSQNQCKIHFNTNLQIMPRSPPFLILTIWLALSVVFVLLTELFRVIQAPLSYRLLEFTNQT